MLSQLPPAVPTVGAPLSSNAPIMDAQCMDGDPMQNASKILLLFKKTTIAATDTAPSRIQYHVELPFDKVIAMKPAKALSETTVSPTTEEAKVGTKVRSWNAFRPCKRGRYEEEQKEGWNINARCHAGGIPAMTSTHLSKDAKIARMDKSLGTVTKKLSSPDMTLTFCMHVVPGGVPLAKWPIPEIAKELKIMEDLRLFSLDFAPNMKGIIHPYLQFSSVDIPEDDFDNFVIRAFPKWAKKERAFYNFSSSVGLSKTPQINEAGQRVVVLTFCPPAYNNNLARLCTAHGRKPKITPVQCGDACCHGKWTPELWQSVLTPR